MNESERTKAGAKSSTVHSVVVAAKLLEFLAESGRPQRVTDIAAHLGMTKARVSRHLSTLSDIGHGARECRTRAVTGSALRYSGCPTPRWTSTKSPILRTATWSCPAQPVSRRRCCSRFPRAAMRWSCRRLRAARRLGPQPRARYALEYSHVADGRRSSWRSRRTSFGNGCWHDGGAGAGPRGVAGPESQQRQGVCARFSVDSMPFNEDPHDAGFSVISAPIFDHAERLEAALTIVMTRTPSATVNQETRFLRQIKETAIDISRALGFRRDGGQDDCDAMKTSGISGKE